MMQTTQGVEAEVRRLAEPLLARDGIGLVDVEYRREAAGWTLTLFIDKQGGVSLDDCQHVSRTLSTVLDVEDPIPHRYNLQVSSPGLDRPLRRESDFVAAVGSLVRIATHEPVGDRRHFTGRLTAAGPEAAGAAAGNGAGPFRLHVTDETGTTRAVPLDVIRKAHIVYEWPEPPERPAGRGRKRPGRKRA